MVSTLIIIELFVLGLVLGSFAGATVWRLRARQLREDKALGDPVDKKEYQSLKKLLEPSLSKDRSQCLHCHHQLAWYDLLPLVSWLQLRGKCRYCHYPIGRMEPIIELGTGTLFALSYVLWPTQLHSSLAIIQFVVWLVAGLAMVILLAYDTRWFLLPNRVMFPLIAVGVLSAILRLATSANIESAIVDLLGACVILSGLYYILYVISRGTWIGFGDIKLGLAMGCLLGEWKLAFLTLFLANLIGCVLVIPGLFLHKLNRSSRVPFGPMLIVAYFIVGLLGEGLISWYLGSLSFY